MTKAVYPKAKEALFQDLNMATANIKVVLVDEAEYTYNATHQFLSSIPVAGRISASANLSGKTFTNGVFRADNPTFSGGGVEGEAIAIYEDSGDAATSRLIYYNNEDTGLPVLTSGNIQIQWDAGVNGIFAL